MAKTILIIDDDDDIAGAATIVLEGAGYKVVRAANGREGLDLGHAARPDLILLDVMMPVMDGFGFSAEASGDGDLRDVPVVVFTAFGQDITELAPGGKSALGVDVAAHIEKPVEPNTLLYRVEEIIGR